MTVKTAKAMVEEWNKAELERQKAYATRMADLGAQTRRNNYYLEAIAERERQLKQFRAIIHEATGIFPH